MVILRGNKPLQLDKMIYKEHPLANKLKDSPISEYHPKWNLLCNFSSPFYIINFLAIR